MNRTISEQIQPSTAAQWYARLHNDSVTSETDAAFRAWLEQSPNNEAAYERCEIAVELARELKNDPDLRPYKEAVASLAGGYQKRLNSWKFRWIRPLPVAASVAAATLLLAGLAALILPPSYSTAVGEQRTVVLSDQTLVRLNTDTKITVDYSAQSRYIHLKKGEAFFEVTSDSNRPFKVFAGTGSATALGTVFDVVLLSDRVTVSVIEGRVQVAPTTEQQLTENTGKALPVLAVGEAVTYSQSGELDAVTDADTRRINAWREGKLAFNNLRLIEAVNDHNRYTRRKILIGDNSLNDLSVSGVFRIGDTDSLVFLLEQSLGISAMRKDDQIILVLQEPR